MSEIKTYPAMNKEIKYILGKSENFGDQYAAVRIVELEKEVKRLKEYEEFYQTAERVLGDSEFYAVVDEWGDDDE